MFKRDQQIADIAERKRLQEEERIKIDQQWAAIKDQERQECVRKAKELQYSQTDRARRLQSEVLQKLVLKERDQQIAFKQAKQEQMARSVVQEIPLVEHLSKAGWSSIPGLNKNIEEILSDIKQVNAELSQAKRQREQHHKQEKDQLARQIMESAKVKQAKDIEQRQLKHARDVQSIRQANEELKSIKNAIKQRHLDLQNRLMQDVLAFQERKQWERRAIADREKQLHQQLADVQEKAARAFIQEEQDLLKKRSAFLDVFLAEDVNFLRTLGSNHASEVLHYHSHDYLTAGKPDPKQLNAAKWAEEDRQLLISMKQDIEAYSKSEFEKMEKARAEAVKYRNWNLELAQELQEKRAHEKAENSSWKAKMQTASQQEDEVFEEYKKALLELVAKYE